MGDLEELKERVALLKWAMMELVTFHCAKCGREVEDYEIVFGTSDYYGQITNYDHPVLIKCDCGPVHNGELVVKLKKDVK